MLTARDDNGRHHDTLLWAKECDNYQTKIALAKCITWHTKPSTTHVTEITRWLSEPWSWCVLELPRYMILHEIVWLLMSTNLNKYLFGIIRSDTRNTGGSKKLLVLRLHWRWGETDSGPNVHKLKAFHSGNGSTITTLEHHHYLTIYDYRKIQQNASFRRSCDASLLWHCMCTICLWRLFRFASHVSEWQVLVVP